MILDEQALFSNNQAVTTSTASTNIINLGKREISFGTPVELFIQVSEAFNNLTDLTIKIQTAEEEAFSSPVSLAEQTIALEGLKQGAVSSLRYLPTGNLGYMRLYYEVNGTTPTTGKILAGIVYSPEQSHHNK